jgi:hypothetical protein
MLGEGASVRLARRHLGLELQRQEELKAQLDAGEQGAKCADKSGEIHEKLRV